MVLFIRFYTIAILLMSCTGYCASSHFVSEKTASPRQPSRNQLRGELIDLFDTCTHTLLAEIEALNTIAHTGKLLQKTDLRLQQIHEMTLFFEQGITPTYCYNHRSDNQVSFQKLIEKLIETVRTILYTIRHTIEESKECCFYTTRSKEMLQNYKSIVKTFIEESRTFTANLNIYFQQSLTKPSPSTKESPNGVV